MTTLRELLLISNSNYEPNNRSSLDEWLSSILDIPLERLGVGDVARAIRQGMFLEYILPKAEILLKNDPLAGEDYDGQLISSIASLSHDEIKTALIYVLSISTYLNQLDKDNLDSQVVMDIAKIDKLSHSLSSESRN